MWKHLITPLLAAALAPAMLEAQAPRTVAEENPALHAESKKLQSWGRDPEFVRAVTEQNARQIPLSQIRELDKTWIGNSGIDARKSELMSNSCAARLKALVAANPVYVEAFVMDNQGAIVCMTNKTSDYWQGDEAKWQRSFDGGRGAVFVDRPRYDTSARVVLAQISIPVVEGARAIGAITVGVNVERLGRQSPGN